MTLLVLLAAGVATITLAVPEQEPLSASGTANPELVRTLAQKLGTTPVQAEAVAGALFDVARERLSEDDFAMVRSAVPGMDGLLKAAARAKAGGPRLEQEPGAIGTTGGAGAGTTGTAGTIAGRPTPAMPKAAGPMSETALALSRVGMRPELAPEAVPVLVDYVSKLGGPDVATILTGALK